jgi:hypothetical protein
MSPLILQIKGRQDVTPIYNDGYRKALNDEQSDGATDCRS